MVAVRGGATRCPGKHKIFTKKCPQTSCRPTRTATKENAQSESFVGQAAIIKYKYNSYFYCAP